MIPDPSLVQESVERAKSIGLESIIKNLSRKDNYRGANATQIAQRRIALQGQGDDPLVAQTRVERILQGNELMDIGYLAQGVVASHAVCRIIIRRDGQLQGFGTGFLIAPGIVLTNHHIFPTIDDIRESIAQFRYERDLQGRELTPTEFALRVVPEPIIFKDLDFALVAVEPRSSTGESLDQFGWLKLNPRPGKAFIGEYLTIIQHPNGERKQVCVRENKLLKYSENGPFLWYETDTVPGASGSPVFNNSWEVVGLHHSSVPKTKRVDGQDVWLAKNGQVWKSDMAEDQVWWKANEGIRISRIMQYLQSQQANHPLAQTVLTVEPVRVGELLVGRGDTADEISIRSDRDGITRILLPIAIGVKIGVGERPAVAPSAQLAPVTTGSASRAGFQPLVIEKVAVDQTTYNKRNGFDPKFLGNGLVVPLPKVKGTKFGQVLAVQGKHELKYWNYSVVMNRTRRLAFFSACNVDSNKFRGKRDAQGDTWYFDTRIAKEAQLGNDFYKKQKTFEADRTHNPFDQGHLSSREQLQWGDDDLLAKRNADDSYHYTNCSPQHWQFNQNNKASGLWFRLEESSISKLSSGGRLCIINGPVFDAPASTPGSDGEVRLNLKGKRVPDGKFGGVKIPRLFFKVIVYAVNKELNAKAFVVTQETLLATIDRYYAEERAAALLTDQEIKLYQVKVADLEDLTGLDFGGLDQYDVPTGQESLAMTQGLPIQDEADIVF